MFVLNSLEKSPSFPKKNEYYKTTAIVQSDDLLANIEIISAQLGNCRARQTDGNNELICLSILQTCAANQSSFWVQFWATHSSNNLFEKFL